MNIRSALLTGCLFLAPTSAFAQGEALTIDREPVLRVTAGGPTALVTALAFSANSQALYAGGYDKVLHAWAQNPQHQFVASGNAYRVPVGPGIDGAINSVAISPDGNYVAVAGRGMLQHGGVPGFRQLGIFVPTVHGMSDAMWEDQGAVYVFDTRTGAAQQLRGHRGPVLSLAFAAPRPGAAPLLASVAREYQGKGWTGAVRLWDVTQGQEVAHLLNLPDLVASQRVLWPHLALWHTGAAPRQVRVALAWDDGTLRLWDVDRAENNVLSKPDGDFNNTLAYLATPDRLLTASFSSGIGALKLWNVPAGKAPDVAKQMALPKGHKPRALALLASEAGGTPNRAAVIVEAADKKGAVEYLLYLFDVANLKPVGEPLRLGGGSYLVPALAVSADSRFLAAVGNKDHEIHVFAVADLLNNKDNRQRLRGAGAPIVSAAFVKNGANTGLVLSESPEPTDGKPQPGDVVFEFGQRTLTSKLAGWQPDGPDTAGWEVRESSVKDERGRPQPRLQVLHNRQPLGTVRLKPGALWITHALLPPTPQRRVPILAVAHIELGQAMLGLYDARSGEHFRQLTGHVNRIRSLRFAADGRLLVSAADDQVVCVWNLTDIDKILGSRGMVHGLAVGLKDGAVVLEELDTTHMADANRQRLKQAGVQVGDVIDGFVVDGKLQPLKTVLAYYDGIIVREPGQTVAVRFRNRGDVTLTVGQGIDDHKPLFSLFVTRGAISAERRWIGWSPIGPYDASDRDAERLLGWHQNTGDPRKPVTFSLAREHRDANYRPDILRYLVARGSLGQAIEAWQKDHPEKAREPKMSLWLNEPGLKPATDGRGQVVVAQPPAKLFLSIHEAPLGKVQSVRWQLDGQTRGEFTVDPTDDREWSANLPALSWKQGTHRIRFTLRTAVPDTLEYPREVVVSYQPPRPVIKVAGLPRVVDQAEYRLQAEVVPGEGRPVQVRVLQRHLGKDLIDDRPTESKKSFKIDRKLKLEPGLNQVKIIARNEGGDEDESDTVVLEVLYKTPRPLITLAQVETADAPGVRLDPDRADKPIVVDVPRVRIVGDIEAPAPLTGASWVSGEPVKGEKPTALAVDKQKRLAIRQDVVLGEPGKPVKVRFQARTATSDAVERFVILQYQPRLPEVRLTSPVDGQPFIAGEDARTVRVEGRLLWPIGRYPCTAAVVVNDKEQGAPTVLDPQAQTFTGQAVLQPGENSIHVRLKNDWRAVTSETVSVCFRRPPRVVALRGPAKAAKPFTDLVAEVESARDLPLTHVRIKGNELPASAAKPEPVGQDGDVTRYRMTFRGVPLQHGKNHIEFLASNADGWSRKPAMVDIELMEVAEPRAEVSFLQPQQDQVVEAAQFTAEFQVRSRSPLLRIELRRSGNPLYQRTDFSEVAKSDGWFVVRGKHAVPLTPGPNPLQVVAQNAGGEQLSPPIVVTYRTAPVTVRIDQLLVQGAPLTPALVSGDDTPIFRTAEAHVRLIGHVEWEPQSDAALVPITHVRVSVNGYQQPGAVLLPAERGRRSRAFQTDVALTRVQGNIIAVKLPAFPQEQHSRTQCIVNCTQASAPVEPRRQAHLLIVDTEKNLNESALVQRVCQGLQAVPAATGRFTQPGFADGGRIYGPLSGADVTPEKVYVQLQIIKRSLRKRAETGAVHDVVFLYFRGGETIDPQGHFFRTSDSDRDPELRWSGIPCDFFNRYFAENLGAQFVLLDVTRDTPARTATATQPVRDQVVQWPADSYVTVVRYAWNGSAQTQSADARLITDWTAATSQAPTLRDVLKTLGTKFVAGPTAGRESIRYRDRLTYFSQVPAALEDFRVREP